MTTVYVDDDADLSLLQDRNVAVLGYDDLSRAEALCLRDSGVDVRVGVAPGSEQWADVEADGLRVVTPYEACEEADLVVDLCGLADDSGVPDVVAANLVAGDVVVIGPAVTAPAADRLPSDVDVIRAVPWADGPTLREEYSQGRGTAMFIAVLEDASGDAWGIGLAYARAVGATRAGVVRVRDEEYWTAERTAERAFSTDVLRAIRDAFASLVGGGGSPELAYLTCVHGLAGLAARLESGALDSAMTTPDASALTTPDASGLATRDASSLTTPASPASRDGSADASPLDSFVSAAAVVRSLIGRPAAGDSRLD